MIREIKIRPVLNGFLVEVGCQSIVLDSVAKLSAEVSRYYTNPDAIELEYTRNAINKLNEGPVPCAPNAVGDRSQVINERSRAEQCGSTERVRE